MNKILNYKLLIPALFSIFLFFSFNSSSHANGNPSDQPPVSKKDSSVTAVTYTPTDSKTVTSITYKDHDHLPKKPALKQSSLMQSSQSVYHFEDTTFSNYIWVKGGAYFPNPDGMDFEMGTAGPVAVVLYDTSGEEVYRQTFQGTHWKSAYFHATGSYKIKIEVVGDFTGTQEIYQGDVYYYP
ncbi:hypothetical protein J2T17_007460 [Paenibacillus mucilaginosus]|uniref:hypothetical protein n=1 Tax=Paenibacillus mucilaginosus TaxID=61624 RepID=UPI003D1F9020